MLLNNLARIGAATVMVIGVDMANSHNPWIWVSGSIVFVFGFQLLTEATVLWDQRRQMPYRWTCPICKKRGKPTGMDSSEEFIINDFRDSHNRTVHLMEP